MLRLRPTVISLTRTDVTEVIHRRQLRRYLQYEDDDASIAFAPAETGAICSTAPSKPSSSRWANSDATPARRRGTRDVSLSPVCNRVRPLVADLPLGPVSDKGPEEDAAPPSGDSTARGGRRGARDEQEGDSAWSLQLCLRPKRSLSASTTVVNNDAAGSTESCDSLDTFKKRSPDDGQTTSWRHDASRDPGSPSRLQKARSTYSSEQGSAPLPPAHWGTLPTNTRSKSDEGPSAPQRIPPVVLPVRDSASDALSDEVSPRRSRGSDPCPLAESSSRAAARRTAAQLQVYNDRIPALYQPQTPQNLPESRHQSRLQGALTAPTRQTSPPSAWTPTTGRSRRGFGRGRQPSPLGLRTPGYTGLYGGMENVDDAALAEAEELEDMVRGWVDPSRPNSSA